MDALLFPLLLALLAGFMFLSMRKQKKRVAEMQEMQNSVSTGTRVQLTSGLFGTVIDASSPDVVDVEIATGVVTRWNRLAVMRVVPTDEAAATYAGHVAPEIPSDDYDD
ncbi:preprotein translocase subunit YajC, partial [Gordonia terrae]